MITRRNYYRIVFGILGIVISYLLFAFISHSISQSRLSTIEGESKFDITTIINISKDRIITESETFNEKEFIEYNCIVDSLYYITIVKVGKMYNIELLDSICFSKSVFQNRDGWFNHDIATPHPMFNMLHANYFTWYNVFLMPFKEINTVHIFIEGDFVGKERLNNTTLSYSLKASRVLFSFNNMNKADLYFAHTKALPPSLSNIFFTVDEDNNLYIGCASTNINNIPKTLSEIIN